MKCHWVRETSGTRGGGWGGRGQDFGVLRSFICHFFVLKKKKKCCPKGGLGCKGELSLSAEASPTDSSIAETTPNTKAFFYSHSGRACITTSHQALAKPHKSFRLNLTSHYGGRSVLVNFLNIEKRNTQGHISAVHREWLNGIQLMEEERV